MSIRDELLQIKGGDDLLKPEAAVEWARANPDSDLHASLEWDDAEAAQNWRIWQVRRLIAVHIISDEGHRGMISLSIDRVNRSGGGYRDIDDVLPDRTLREMMLADALRDLDRLKTKYSRLQELARVWEEAEAVRTRRGRGRRRRGSTGAEQPAASA